MPSVANRQAAASGEILEQVLQQFARVASRPVCANRQRRDLIGRLCEFDSAFDPEAFDPTLGEPTGKRERVGQVCGRIILDRREHDLVVFERESAQDRVDESGRSIHARCADAAHRLVDGRAGRDAIGAQQLIRAELKCARDQRFELGEILVDEMTQVVVDLPAPAERSVDEIRRKRAIRCVEAGARERRMKQQVCVSARTRYALEHAKREQPGVGGGRSSPSIGCGGSSWASAVGSDARFAAGFVRHIDHSQPSLVLVASTSRCRSFDSP